MGRLRGWGSSYESQASVLRLTGCPHFDWLQTSTRQAAFQSDRLDLARPRPALAKQPGSLASGSKPPSHVEVMIPRRQDCEGDRRSWRIAICSCEAVAHNFVAFLRKPLLRPLESSSNLSSHSGTGNALSGFAIRVLWRRTSLAVLRRLNGIRRFAW